MLLFCYISGITDNWQKGASTQVHAVSTACYHPADFQWMSNNISKTSFYVFRIRATQMHSSPLQDQHFCVCRARHIDPFFHHQCIQIQKVWRKSSSFSEFPLDWGDITSYNVVLELWSKTVVLSKRSFVYLDTVGHGETIHFMQRNIWVWSNIASRNNTKVVVAILCTALRKDKWIQIQMSDTQEWGCWSSCLLTFNFFKCSFAKLLRISSWMWVKSGHATELWLTHLWLIPVVTNKMFWEEERTLKCIGRLAI